MCWIPDDKQSNPGLLLTNKRFMKPITNDSCKEEPVTDHNNNDYTDDYYDFCHWDSDDEEEEQQKAAATLENSCYILTAGTIITFRPQSIFMNEGPITCKIDTIKEDCDSAKFPLVVQGGRQLVDNDMYMRVEGKTHPFCFRSVILQPGSIVSQTKNIKKPTIGKILHQYYEMENEQESGRECRNLKKMFHSTKKNKNYVSTNERT